MNNQDKFGDARNTAVPSDFMIAQLLSLLISRLYSLQNLLLTAKLFTMTVWRCIQPDAEREEPRPIVTFHFSWAES